MKFDFIDISHGQWLNMLNEEAHPKKDLYEIDYYRCADSVFVYLKSGVGNFFGPTIPLADCPKNELDSLLKEHTKELEDKYVAAKEKLGQSGEQIMGSKSAFTRIF